MDAKQKLRSMMRAQRRAHVAELAPSTRALVFMRPPAPVLALVPEGACVGLYYPTADEASPLAYARWLHEQGRTVALPWFAGRGSEMTFRAWDNPLDETTLLPGPYGIRQPLAAAREVVPTVLFVPLVAFTARGERLGQGGGHYDRWLAAHAGTTAIGMAWDCQQVEALPSEPHDHRLRAVVTPTRIHESLA